MSESRRVEILYFTDILCIWAYIAQIRMDELKAKFGTDISINGKFVSVFGSVESKMEKNWKHRGGISAYSAHVIETAEKFDHISIHPEVWLKNTPSTSASCHLFLKAIQLLEDAGELADIQEGEGDAKSIFERTAWQLRLAFFQDAVDISDFSVQMSVAESLALPPAKIEKLLKNGAAFAAMEVDLQSKEEFGITGSPTLVLNDGRQKIYGNVGYRVIEANVMEILSQPQTQASWC